MQLLQCFLLLFAVAAAAMWDQNLWAERRRIGGNGGHPFTLVAETGTVVEKIRVYRKNEGRRFLRGIRVFYSDGAEAFTGQEQDEYSEFSFEDGERITSMTLWGNGIGTRTGRIR